MKNALQAEVSHWLRFAQEDLREAKRLSQSATAVPSDYAVDARYPVGAPEITEEDAGQAVADAAKIVEVVAAEIGDRLRA